MNELLLIILFNFFLFEYDNFCIISNLIQLRFKLDIKILNNYFKCKKQRYKKIEIIKEILINNEEI